MITLTIDRRLSLFPLRDLPPPVLERFQDRLTFDNPVWLENEKHGYSNWRVPEKLRFYRIDDDQLIMPRGFIGQAIWILREEDVPYQVADCTRRLPEVDFHFVGQLKDFQVEAVAAIQRRDFGTLAAPTGSGKTVMALAAIARRRQPALVVVHSKELLHQWIERIEAFLGIPAAEVGVIGCGQRTLGKRLTVALVQTLYKCAAQAVPHFGFLVVDECHRCPARTFTEAVTAFDSKYMLGLSATPCGGTACPG